MQQGPLGREDRVCGQGTAPCDRESKRTLIASGYFVKIVTSKRRPVRRRRSDGFWRGHSVRTSVNPAGARGVKTSPRRSGLRGACGVALRRARRARREVVLAKLKTRLTRIGLYRAGNGTRLRDGPRGRVQAPKSPYRTGRSSNPYGRFAANVVQPAASESQPTAAPSALPMLLAIRRMRPPGVGTELSA